MSYSEDEIGAYYRMPEGIRVDIVISDEKTSKSMQLKGGMSKKTLIELARQKDFYINKKKWLLCNYYPLVFKNDRLVGIR